MKQMKLSKHLRLGSNSALSNNNNSALDNYPGQKNATVRLKNGSHVPDSFLVPMILRKTKLKQ